MKLIYTSDIHSYLFPTDYSSTEEKNMGYYRIIESYTKDEDTVVIDCGDNLQGSVLSKYVMDKKLFSPFPQAKTLRDGKVDFLVPGNHDFNYGYDIFCRFFNETGGKILAANLRDTSGKLDIINHAVVTDSKGLRVGFTGVITDWVNVWEKSENLGPMVISDSREAAERELKWLKENSDISVLIYHGGYEYDLDTGEKLQDTRENIAYELCRDLSYDLILTGHQHRSVAMRDINGTKTMQCPSFALSYVEVDITKDSIKGEIKKPLDKKSKGEVENHALSEEIEKWLDQEIGRIDNPILAPERVESALKGNHIADFFNYLQLYYTGADISCTALNNNLYSFSSSITVREILSSCQYPNSIYVIEVGEKEIRAALERSAEFFTLENGKPTISKVFLEPKAEMYNYDYYMGISYTYDISKEVGNRVVRLLWKGEEIGERKLRLAINNYRITGAGGYPLFPKCKVIKSCDWDMQDQSIEFFKEMKGKVVSWPYGDFKTIGY
ncbi:MAG: 5'-nucleotidase C-terminal domain-containing protein [Spirochaetales bacterium]|nr:5'-nucleotidase C-terminal domain-containing protein [Spirochaetales bacterium]